MNMHLPLHLPYIYIYLAALALAYDGQKSTLTLAESTLSGFWMRQSTLSVKQHECRN